MVVNNNNNNVDLSHMSLELRNFWQFWRPGHERVPLDQSLLYYCQFCPTNGDGTGRLRSSPFLHWVETETTCQKLFTQFHYIFHQIKILVLNLYSSLVYFTHFFMPILNAAYMLKNPRTVCVLKTYKCTRHAHWRQMLMRRYKHSRELSNAGNLVTTTTTQRGKQNNNNVIRSTLLRSRGAVSSQLSPGAKYTHN